MGRLFDAASSLAGVCHRVEYEAEAAMRLENAALGAPDDVGDDGRAYGFILGAEPGGPELPLTADPSPVLAAAAADVLAGAPAPAVAARFHRAVTVLVRDVCAEARRRTGIATVALTGGALLTEGCSAGLEEDGFTVLGHRKVPPNDGGLALGQLMVAARTKE